MDGRNATTTNSRANSCGAGVWRRRRRHGRRMCAANSSGGGIPRALGPNDLAIYQIKFPPAYRGGAFMSPSWILECAPLPQAGYNVVFQPLAHGKASGPFVVFADGFAGANKDPGRAAFRPTGLAEGPDGALYVSDDVHGRIWRITYTGDGLDKVAPAPTPAPAVASLRRRCRRRGVHPDAGRPVRSLPTVDLDRPRTLWRWEIGFSMGRRARARAAAVMVLTLAERRRVHR